jgi:hypothetical protein
MGYRFDGGSHLFQPASRIIAPSVGFGGDVRATILGKVTATASVTVGGAADVTAGPGARFDMGAAKLTVAGDGALHLNAGANVTVGALSVADRGRLDTADDLTVSGALDLGGGTVTLLPGATRRVLRVGAFNAPAAGGGRVDLTRNGMIVDYAAGASPLADVAAAVARGYHGGAWDGPGITSADAATAPTRSAVGYAEANTVLRPGETFLGQAVDDTAVLVRFTLSGDATLDGVVDFDDLVAVAQNYNRGSPIGDPRRWREGDFTYDGVVDFNDLVLLAQNYNGVLPAAAAAVPGASAAFSGDLTAAFAAVVPEPLSGSAAIGAGALLHLTRRRRRPNLARSA